MNFQKGFWTVYFLVGLIFNSYAAQVFAGSLVCKGLLRSSAEKNLRDQEKDRDFSYYVDQMDASMKEKLEKILPWLPESPSIKVGDIGTGSGSLAASIAEITKGFYFRGRFIS